MRSATANPKTFQSTIGYLYKGCGTFSIEYLVAEIDYLRVAFGWVIVLRHAVRMIAYIHEANHWVRRF